MFALLNFREGVAWRLPLSLGHSTRCGRGVMTCSLRQQRPSRGREAARGGGEVNGNTTPRWVPTFTAPPSLQRVLQPFPPPALLSLPATVPRRRDLHRRG